MGESFSGSLSGFGRELGQDAVNAIINSDLDNFFSNLGDIVAAKIGISARRDDFVGRARPADHRKIEGAATQIVDADQRLVDAIDNVGQRSCAGLVDNNYVGETRTPGSLDNGFAL